MGGESDQGRQALHRAPARPGRPGSTTRTLMIDQAEAAVTVQAAADLLRDGEDALSLKEIAEPARGGAARPSG